MHVDPSIAARYERSRLRGGEVLITLVGSTGQVAVAPPRLADWNVARAIGVIPVRDTAYARWVAWCLQAPAARSFLEARLNTTVQHTLNLRDLGSVLVPVPPPPEREAVGAVLGALEDKIDSNRRLAGLMEETAAAIFRARFVDFVGVHEFEESDLGRLPRGGQIGRLADVVNQRIERCRPSEANAVLPYVPIDVISSRSLMLEDHKPGEEAKSSLTRFEAGDILFGAMRPYFHKVAIAPFDGTTRTTVFVLRPADRRDWAFAVLLLTQPETVEYATRTSRGSTIPYAVWENVLNKMAIVIPSPEDRAAFNEEVAPMLRMVQNMGFEQRMLATIRDVLLPKLVSGQIHISDTRDPAEVIEPAAEPVAGL